MAILVLLCLLGISSARETIWRDDSNIPNGAKLDVEVHSSPSGWWDAAYTGCGDGWLYTSLVGSSDKSTLSNKLQDGIKYWLGGVQSLSWKWTINDEPFNTYNGFVYLSDARRLNFTLTSTTLEKNSAQACQEKCRYLFGLQGKTCFCIKTNEGLLRTQKPLFHGEAKEMRCPGSFDDRCGNSEGMSIYTADVLTPSPYELMERNYPTSISQEDECAYFSCQTAVIGLFKGFYSTKDCEQKMGFICSGLHYVGKNMTWESASQYCSLSDIGYGSLQFVIGVHVHDMCPHTLGEITSWIGLRVQKKWKWLDGFDINDKISSETTLGRGCLAVSKDKNGDGGLSLSRENCLSKFPFVCEKVLQAMKTCNEVSVMDAIAKEQIVTDPNAGKCPDGSHDRSEALLLSLCGTMPTNKWKPGAKVLDSCSSLPLHSPIATFQLSYYVETDNGLAGIFLGCTANGFTMAVQMCGQPPRIVHLNKGQSFGFASNADNYYAITYRDYSATPIIG